MRPGELVDDRFEIEGLAGTGGMGAVYRARDRAHGGGLVALKVLLAGAGTPGTPEAERFAREAEVLAGLSHPGIVRFVAHGRAAEGAPYLAMEWLEGEDLAQRLARLGGALPATEALAYVREAAEALAAAHARGVVHRDLKPGNLFLAREGDALDRVGDGAPRERVVVLDFGVARLGGRAQTRTGTALGTPGYMAPEQVRGVREVDARADVFSLGCLLFELLSGRLPFEGEHPVAVLSKILTEEAPRLRSVLADAPDALDALVADMTARDPARRPRDAAALLPLLRALELDAASWALGRARSEALSLREQRLVCVLLASEGAALGAEARAPAVDPRAGAGATAKLDDGALAVDAACAALNALGAASFVLPEGSLLATFVPASDDGAAPELLRRALRAASRVLPTLPASMRVALATGGADAAHTALRGEAYDRAAALVRDAGTAAVAAASAAATEGAALRLDAASAALARQQGLEPAGSEAGALLDARALERWLARAGEPWALASDVPFVARERELRRLEDLRAESDEDARARVALVLGPAGVGKTRLARELLARAERAGARTLWVAAREEDRGVPFALAAQLVRALAGVSAGASEAAQVRALEGWVRALGVRDGARHADALGALLGLARSLAVEAPWAAQREDPAWQREAVREALEATLDAALAGAGHGADEGSEAPGVVWVLDELHHGDDASLRALDALLRSSREARWLLVGVARGALLERAPGLFAEREVQVLRLGELARRPAEQLAKAALGARATSTAVEALLARAGGSPLCIELLARGSGAALDGAAALDEGAARGSEEAARAVLLGALAGLEAPVRRAARAASVFGARAWEAGVAALLGDDAVSVVHAQGALERLVEGGWLARGALVEGARVDEEPAGLAGQASVRFRVGLAREASYASLTEADRARGHKLAADWLERAGETRPAELARHREAGGQSALAAECYERAAAAALALGDADEALRCTARARACGASGAGLRAVSAAAHAARGQATAVLDEALPALGLDAGAASAPERTLAPGSGAWSAAVHAATWAAEAQGDGARLAQLAVALREAEPANDARYGYARAAASLCNALCGCAAREPLAALAARVTARLRDDPSPAVRAQAQRCALAAARARGAVDDELRASEGALDAFARAGYAGGAARAQLEHAQALLWSGAWPAALAALRAAHERARRSEASLVAAACEALLAYGAWQQGDATSARALAATALDALEAPSSSEPLALSAAQRALGLAVAGLVAAQAGNPTRGREALEAAVRESAGRPFDAVAPRALYARWMLREGDARGALAQARAALAPLGLDDDAAAARDEHAAGGATPAPTPALAPSEPVLVPFAAAAQLVCVDALVLLGEGSTARRVLGRARDALEAHAARIADEGLRARHLRGVAEHARLVETTLTPRGRSGAGRERP